MKNSWQVATAAEAFAAAQLARCGWDVSVQYGANQPEYDLVAVDRDRVLKVSVKGSQDGQWGLTQSLLENADYHGAADKWRSRHSKKTVLCLVQFKDTSIETLPRMYLATPQEISDRLKATAAGRGDTILHEEHAWRKNAHAAGTIDAIPESWRFTERRLEEMVQKTEQVGLPDMAPTACR
jgi:Holliday junction resolvase-like predicted endonuclease